MAVQCSDCPLRKVPLFSKMTPQEVTFTAKFKKGELSVDAGTPILSEGSSSPQMFTALSGMGLRYKLLEDGKRQVVGFVMPGDFIGLQAGVMREMQHSVDAVTPMTLCVFDRSELWSLFRNHPRRAFDLTWLAAAEERFLGEALTAIGQSSAMERLAWAICRIFMRLDRLGLRDGNSVPFPFRQQDLADALGLSLVHTNKSLKKLRDWQLVQWNEGRLSIWDFERLARLAPLTPNLPDERPLI